MAPLAVPGATLRRQTLMCYTIAVVEVPTDTRIHDVSAQPARTHTPLAGATRFLAYLITYLRPYRLSFAVVVAGSLLDSALNAVIPLSFKFMIDRAVGGRTREGLLLPLIVSLAVLMISLAGTGRDYMYSNICTRVMADLRYKIFEHLQRLSLDYYSRAQVGDILSHFSNDQP